MYSYVRDIYESKNLIISNLLKIIFNIKKDKYNKLINKGEKIKYLLKEQKTKQKMPSTKNDLSIKLP